MFAVVHERWKITYNKFACIKLVGMNKQSVRSSIGVHLNSELRKPLVSMSTHTLRNQSRLDIYDSKYSKCDFASLYSVEFVLLNSMQFEYIVRRSSVISPIDSYCLLATFLLKRYQLGVLGSLNKHKRLPHCIKIHRMSY